MAGGGSAVCLFDDLKGQGLSTPLDKEVIMQVPVIAKADSMTVDELRQFRKYIRSELEQVYRGRTVLCLSPCQRDHSVMCVMLGLKPDCCNSSYLH